MITPNYSLPFVNKNGDTRSFAVNKIICIGRNYAEHAREMGHDPEREPPFFFFKPQSALAQNGVDFIYPDFSQQIEYEIELVVAIGKSGKAIEALQADDYVAGFGVGLDMTCRDVQKQAKQLGRPWELAKGFDGSAPCTAIRAGKLADLEQFGDLILTNNGEQVQRGNWRALVWAIPDLIAEVSRYVQLNQGDLIFTGTPAGVGQVKPGDQLEAKLQGFAEVLQLKVVGPN